MPPKTATTPKKAIPPQGKVKRSPVIGPIHSIPKWVNKVYTASTRADGVFVTWASRSNGSASFVRPLKTHFEKESSSSNLTEEWKVTAIMPRRDFHHPDANAELPASSYDSMWGWDSFVTVATEGDTATSVGKHITGVFNEHETNAAPGQKRSKLQFAFCGEVSDAKAGLKPLSHFLLDEDVAEVFKSVYAGSNEKEFMLGQDVILEGFFGSAEKGRDVLEVGSWAVST